MPLQKLQFKPGITRDMTSLAAEGSWYAGEKIRFRQGLPEKIGGWQRISGNVYQGVCRTLASWVTLAGYTCTGVGTHLKMYVESGGVYNDITPVRRTQVIAANAFTTSNGSSIVTVNDAGHGASTGDFVVISAVGAAVGGISAATLTGEFQVTVLTVNTYTITVGATASSSTTGSNATFTYQIAVGAATNTLATGWGAGGWGLSGWGMSTGTVAMRLWSQVPYGEWLLFGQSGGPLYVFKPDSAGVVFNRGTLLSAEAGASAVPAYQNYAYFSQAGQLLVLLGTQSYTGGSIDPLLVRWSGAQNIVNWTPAANNQTGEYRLSKGSYIATSAAARQDRLILTNTTAYLQQYVGPPYVLSHTEAADNISVLGPNAIVSANGVVFWMGTDKFYVYDGRVQPLPCPLLQDVFGNINLSEGVQAFGGTNEGFNEAWFFYCSAASTTPDKYVIFNYVSNTWAYGNITRTAWLDTPLRTGPTAATTASNLVVHETGTDDLSTASTQAINAWVQTADFDIGDGQSYAFVNKVLPDINFTGSSAASPTVYMTVNGRRDPGSAPVGYTAQAVTQTSTTPVSQWTPEVCVRIRGRQMSLKIESTAVGVQWQAGVPRINVRPDGRSA